MYHKYQKKCLYSKFQFTSTGVDTSEYFTIHGQQFFHSFFYPNQKSIKYSWCLKLRYKNIVFMTEKSDPWFSNDTLVRGSKKIFFHLSLYVNYNILLLRPYCTSLSKNHSLFLFEVNEILPITVSACLLSFFSHSFLFSLSFFLLLTLSLNFSHFFSFSCALLTSRKPWYFVFLCSTTHVLFSLLLFFSTSFSPSVSKRRKFWERERESEIKKIKGRKRENEREKRNSFW